MLNSFCVFAARSLHALCGAALSPLVPRAVLALATMLASLARRGVGRLHCGGRQHAMSRLASRIPHLPATATPQLRSFVSGRSPADHLSDELAEANLLLSDLLDDDDRSSDDFKADLEEVRAAYAAGREAYDAAMAALPEKEQVSLRKNFDLAVVGLRDKLVALEEEAGGV